METSNQEVLSGRRLFRQQKQCLQRPALWRWRIVPVPSVALRQD
jgi:hypothetical protein